MRQTIITIFLFLTVFSIHASRLHATTKSHRPKLQVIFMEPDPSNPKASPPAYRLITDFSRLQTYSGWLNNDAAQWALDLFERAWRISREDLAPPSEVPTYYIAIIPEGNEGKLGFQINDKSGVQMRKDYPYIELNPDQRTFETILFHETGHMVLDLLNGGRQIPKKVMAAIPHSTAALTDRETAFDEGFAIHLETLAAHFLDDPLIKNRYNHQQFVFGSPSLLGEYHRIAGDLLSYSQTNTRYLDIRENNFAFVPAFKGPDYFRVQLEKSRDFSELRDPNQLLQSEGFYASFFFSYLVRGEAVSKQTVMDRQMKMMETIAGLLADRKIDSDSPFLLYFVAQSLKMHPEDAKEILDVFLDLSHGVFVDKNAAKLWHDHYLAALHMDLAEKNNRKIQEARDQWPQLIVNDPKILYSRIGPQLRVEVPERSVLLVAFEEPARLSFDLNTVDEGIIRMIPEITEVQVKTWLAQRSEKPFSDYDDFKKRCRLSENVLKHLKF